MNTNTSTHDSNPNKPQITSQRYPSHILDYKAYNLPALYEDSKFSTSLSKLVIFYFKNYYGHPSKCEVVLHWVFICLSLVTGDIEIFADV